MPIASLECEYLLPSHHLPNPIQFNSIQFNGLNPPKPQNPHTHTHKGGKRRKINEPHPQTLTLVSRRSHQMFTTHSSTSCQILFIAKRINHTHNKTQKETESHTERKRESHTQRRIRETERERWGGRGAYHGMMMSF
jgi:hypothetical protein